MPEDRDIIRICEWSSLNAPQLTCRQREAIADLVDSWQITNALTKPPLWFSGASGTTLNARQYVGIVEAEDVAIEIYPKLDKQLLSSNSIQDRNTASSVMSDLLWILDVSGHLGINEYGQAGLEETPTNFYDIFAMLMAKRLLAELALGVPHAYIRMEDNLQAVRGRISLMTQMTRNMNRADLIACEWDEYTPNIPMNQLLKCACRFLQERVKASSASRLLMECSTELEEIDDVDPLTATTGVQNHRWNRMTDRFEPVFSLAKRLLQGMGHRLSTADNNTFVFLLDMNKVFEDYVAAVLAEVFDVGIETQKYVGSLFPYLGKGSVYQLADYVWTTKNGTSFVGDAKYKHLANGSKDSLRFSLPECEGDIEPALAGRILNPGDIRQLTVYAELMRNQKGPDHPTEIMLLYPHIGQGGFKADSATAWNGSRFTICPVSLNRQSDLRDAIPVGKSSSRDHTINAGVSADVDNEASILV